MNSPSLGRRLHGELREVVMNTSKLKLAAVVIGLGLSSILTAPLAQANLIAPGGTVTPDDLSLSVLGSTIVATTSGNFSVRNVAGSYVTDVVRTTLGTLDF